MKDPRVYFVQILECIGRIQSYVSEGKESFIADSMIQDAVIRNLEVIGEAVKRVPDEYRRKNPSIDWRGLSSLRDVLIHQSVMADHPGIDLARVWNDVENELPKIKSQLSALLPPLHELEKELNDEQ